MSKVRINDLARELEVKSRPILDALEAIGVTGKTHSSSIETDQAERVREYFRNGGRSSSSNRQAAEQKPKFDLSKVSKPGDALKAILERKQAEAAAVRTVPPARPLVVAPPAVVAAPPASAQRVVVATPPPTASAPAGVPQQRPCRDAVRTRCRRATTRDCPRTAGAAPHRPPAASGCEHREPGTRNRKPSPCRTRRRPSDRHSRCPDAARSGAPGRSGCTRRREARHSTSR